MNQPMIICSNCRTPNPARNLYCQSCGRPLIPAASTPDSNEMTQPNISQGFNTPPPAQPYAPPPAQEYPPQPTAPVPADPGPEYPPQPQQSYQQQSMPPAYGTPPAQQPGYPPPYTLPPQQAAGTPQNYARVQPQADFFQRLQANVSSLFSGFGRRSYAVKTDSWSTLVSGAGEKASEVEQAFIEDFNRRELTYVDLAHVEVSSGLAQRSYEVARHRAGSVASYFNAAGKDLMLGWEMSVQQKPNWNMIIILSLIAIFSPFFTNLSVGWSFGRFLVQWIFGIFGYILPVFVAAAITGKIIKGDIWALFVEKSDAASQQELSALADAVQQSLKSAVKSAGFEQKLL